MADNPPSETLRKIRRRILSWYRRHRRDFPWRNTRDPYTICVSEVMLHQTQASRVAEKLPGFLRRFPDIRTLAMASRADILRAWRGMGYNNRAIRLQMMARTVKSEYDGAIPSDPEQLQELQGIGKYSARAIACFAFHRRTAVVDVNIHRVLSRLNRKVRHHRDYDPPDRVWRTADAFLPLRSYYEWNQALMDFGAQICTARSPACTACPVKRWCPSSHLVTLAHRTQRNGKSEPSFHGVPRRLWRGRILEHLRDIPPGRSLPVTRLSDSLMPGRRNRPLRWMSGILRAMEKDGLLTVTRRRGRQFVRLAE